MINEGDVVALATHIDERRKERGGRQGDLAERVKKPLKDLKWEPVWKAMSSDLDIYLAAESQADVEAYFNILVALLVEVARKNNKAVDDFVLKVTSSAVRAAMRHYALSRLLEELLARTEAWRSAIAVLVQATEYATREGHYDLALQLLAVHDTHISSWVLPVEDVRRYEFAVYSLCKKADRISDEYNHLMKYLVTFNAEEDEELLKAQGEHALAAMRMILENYELYENDFILDLKVLSFAGETREAVLLHKLCKILCCGTFGDFKAFLAENDDVTGVLEIDVKRLTARMRQLTLLSMASAKSTLTFREIADQIDVPESEMENYVVRGAALNLFGCRIDQVERNVHFYKTTHRVFGTEQWKHLHERLSLWEERIDSVLAVLEE